jgi:hypothetical protein
MRPPAKDHPLIAERSGACSAKVAFAAFLFPISKSEHAAHALSNVDAAINGLLLFGRQGATERE